MWFWLLLKVSEVRPQCMAQWGSTYGKSSIGCEAWVFGGPFQGSQLSNDPPVGYLISRKTKTYNYFWERSKKKCGYSSISFQSVHITFGYRVSYADRDSNSCCKVETFPSQIRIGQNLNTYFYCKSEINCNKLLSVCNRIILYLLQSCT